MPTLSTNNMNKISEHLEAIENVSVLARTAPNFDMLAAYIDSLGIHFQAIMEIMFPQLGAEGMHSETN